MRTIRNMLIAGLIMLAAPAWAGGGRWAKNHPRRHEVNQRLDRQERRVEAGERKGQLSPQQAAQIRSEDRGIRRQERSMAAKNGGHITRTEKRALNQEENQVSRQIRRERHGR